MNFVQAFPSLAVARKTLQDSITERSGRPISLDTVHNQDRDELIMTADRAITWKERSEILAAWEICVRVLHFPELNLKIQHARTIPSKVKRHHMLHGQLVAPTYPKGRTLKERRDRHPMLIVNAESGIRPLYNWRDF